MSTFAPCTCSACKPKCEKFGNRTPPLARRNSARFHTSICQHQSPRSLQTRVSTKLSVKLESNIVVGVSPNLSKTKITTPRSAVKFQPKVHTKVQPKIDSPRTGQRVSSPARNFRSFAKDLKVFDSTTKSIVKTPTKFRPKSLYSTQSTLNQTAPTALKSTPIAKCKIAEIAGSKIAPMKSVTIVDTERNEIEIEEIGKMDVNSNIESNAVTAVMEEESDVINEKNQYLPVCDEIVNVPTMENNQKLPTEIPNLPEGNTRIEKQGATVVRAEQKTNVDTTDNILATTSSQSKWTDEILKLLNTGSASKISRELVTIGPKTATQITKCREIRGKFEQIEDLKTRLGWTDKVYQKFQLKNFL